MNKMITRRNLLLKCSILANVAVLLYICSHVMVGNNTNNFGMSSGPGASYLIQQLSPTSHQQSTQQKSSLSPAQVLQDEQELATILRNKEIELQKQIKLQENAIQKSKPFWMRFRHREQQPSTSGGRANRSSSSEAVTNWGVNEVITWLEAMQLSEYIDSFIKNDIRGKELLTLARRDLKELGVTKVGHVKRILQAIKDLHAS